MSKYDDQMKAFAEFGMDAIERIPKTYFELFLSLDEKEVIERIVSYTRLYAVELPTPTSVQTMFVLLEKALGDLLAAGKIKVSEYGLSDAGKVQYHLLIGLSEPIEAPPAPIDPKTEYKDVIDVYVGPTSVLNAKMKDTTFRGRFDKAVELNLI